MITQCRFVWTHALQFRENWALSALLHVVYTSQLTFRVQWIFDTDKNTCWHVSRPLSITCLVKHSERCLGVFHYALINDAGLSVHTPPPFLGGGERPIHSKVTLNQSHQEGLKTDKLFLCLSRAIPAVCTDTSALFHTWHQPLPLQNKTQKDRKPGQWQNKCY